ncbi:hypothetical protein [uncultured Nonlabens sp.]|uniref:hypothetical protein n=1 Tax=uncultured Nonlabens sp. TaxID=859306 RepID=UPI00261C2D97|nr:hypothetical protein [uncultured Nonlabens sp.]
MINFTLSKLSFFAFLLLLGTTMNAQVGIGTATPNPDSLLDLDTSTTMGGLLLPRAALSATNNTAPLSNHVAGMVIYNTATAGDVTPGYYYNDGSQWLRIADSDGNDKWDLSGNGGTNASTNFLGTTDNVGLRFRTNNTERFEITNDGRILASQSGSASSPLFSWSGDSNKGFYSPGADELGLVTNGRERLRIPNANAVRAMENGTNALPFYSWNSDANLGIWRSAGDRLNISAGGREMVEFRESGGTSEVVFNDNSTDSNFRVETDNQANMVFIDGADNAVGIGTDSPAGALEINSENSGLVLPRVRLTSIVTAAPVINPQGGALEPGTTVYNTNTAGTPPNNVAPGLYYWNGSRWAAYAGSPGGLDWTLTGNSGTSPIANYVGTSDALPLVLSTDGVPKLLINEGNGEVYVNSFSAFGSYSYRPNYMLQSYGSGVENAIGGFSTGTGYGIRGDNTGGGIGSAAFSNGNAAFYGIASDAVGNGILASGAGAAIYSFPAVGVGGMFAGEYGATGLGSTATGTGTIGMGQGRLNAVVNPDGSGMAASGNSIGLFAYAGLGDVDNTNRGNAAGEFVLDADDDTSTNTGNDGTRARAKLAGFDNVTPDGSQNNRNSYYGGYFSGGSESSNTPSYAYVGMRYRTNGNGNGTSGTGQDYKVIGTGTNSTLIDGPDGTPRIMFSPEAPEILFQDYGVGQLQNGTVTIKLDPILKSAIHVDANHPLKVFVTLEGECNGVYVTDKSGDGFTVKELQGGTSNASFSWQIVASRADRVAPDGTVVSKHVGIRLPEGPGPVEEKQYKTITVKAQGAERSNTLNQQVTNKNLAKTPAAGKQ